MTTEKQKKARGRSPSYPAVDLETAIGRAKELYKQEHMNSASINVILRHWGYNTKSGAGLVTLAALIKFGLLTDEGSGDKRTARLTEPARKIILDDRPNSPERDALIQEAALTPAIHKDLWYQYKGILPSDENLKHELRVNRGFTDYAVSEFIEEFRRTVNFAKLMQSGILSGEGKDKPNGKGDEGTPAAEIKLPAGEIVSRSVQIPYTHKSWAKLEAPFPMSEDDWNQMMAVLAAMKPGLVSPREKPSDAQAPTIKTHERHTLSVEAQELLTKTDNGGIPTSMNSNLETIAKEHGITVNSDTTPNDVIDQLRKLH